LHEMLERRKFRRGDGRYIFYVSGISAVVKIAIDRRNFSNYKPVNSPTFAEIPPLYDLYICYVSGNSATVYIYYYSGGITAAV